MCNVRKHSTWTTSSSLYVSQLITWCVHHHFDDEVKEVTHGVFTPGMMQIPQTTWIETFFEDVTDKSTCQPVFKEIVWFEYKVSGVMCSVWLLLVLTPSLIMSIDLCSLLVYGFTLEGGIDSVRVG